MSDEDNEDKKDSISKFLGMASIHDVIQNKDEIIAFKETPAEVQIDPRRDEDFDASREMIKSVLEAGTDALAEMVVIAQQSQSPLVYEKLGTLMNSLTASSKALMDIHRTKKVIDKAELDTPGLKDSADAAAGTTNIVFAGSTAQLQEYMSQMKKGTLNSD